jgi:Protein of unknown function (DUF5818)
MRQFALSILVLLFSLTWVSAQQNDTATQTNNPGAVPNANSSTPNNDSPNGANSNNRGENARSSNADQKTVEGCLRESSGGYTLESKSGTTYRLMGNTDGLSKYVGKEVRIQGTKASASGDTSNGMVSSSGGSSGVATSDTSTGTEPTVQVSSANVVSDTCR